MDNTTSTASKVRGRRAMLRWTQAKLAQESGLSTYLLRRIENGERSPTTTELGQIAAALSIPPIELLPGSFRAA